MSIDFLLLLHKLLSSLYQIEPLSTLTKCQQLIFPKIKDWQTEEKSSSAPLDTKITFHNVTCSAQVPTREYSEKEQPVTHNNTIEIYSVIQSKENNLNKSNEGTKKRNILDFFKSLFKRN